MGSVTEELYPSFKVHVKHFGEIFSLCVFGYSTEDDQFLVKSFCFSFQKSDFSLGLDDGIRVGEDHRFSKSSGL